MTNTPTTVPTRPENVPAERVVDFDIFDPFNDQVRDYHQAWVGLRDACEFEIVWTPHNEGHWIALEPQLVTEVLTDSSRFSSRIVLVPKSTIGAAYGDFIPLSLDPPAHGPFRKVINKKLMGASLNPLEAGIRKLAQELIESFSAIGRCNFVHDFAEKFPLHVFMQLVDLPLEDLPTLKHLADQFTRPDGSIAPREVGKAFHAYLGPIMAQRKGSGRSDILTHIAESSVDGRPISDSEATNLASQVMVGGLDTVVNFLSYTMLTLANRPDLQQQIASNSVAINKVTDELLRRLPIVSSAREVIDDVTVDGVQLRAGDMVVAPTPLFGLSTQIHERPLEIEFNRPNKQHATFGSGHHTCQGNSLARMEIRVFLEEWFTRIPHFRLAPDQLIRHRAGITAGTDPFVLEWPV